MKKGTKALILGMCAILLVAVTIMGTAAFLTSQDQVTNTFTVGNVNIELDEADVNEDGEYVKDHNTRVKENEYKLIPGMSYIKDPTVTVKAGSEKAYVRMLVKVENINNLMAVFNDAEYYDNGDPENGVFLLEKLVTGWDRTIWEYNDFYLEGTTGVYEFRYFAPIDASAEKDDIVLDDLFETIVIPGEDVDRNNIDLLKAVKIVVLGQAIQVDGFTASGDKTAEDVAWAAFSY